jgi:hypothetical protein
MAKLNFNILKLLYKHFIIKHFFDNIPLRFGRKSLDPASPMWIEPSPSIINDEENQVLSYLI